MLDFVSSFLGWLGATAFPAFVGLLIITLAGRLVEGKYLAAFGMGIFMWFFVDTIGGSANFIVNAGFAGGIDQVAIVALGVIGILFFFSVGGGDLFSSQSVVRGASLTIPLLVAIAVGIHGFGEGTSFGITASSTQSASLLDTFGGLNAGVAYVLHKLLEPMMIGACYVVYAKDRAKVTSIFLRDIFLMAVLFVIPSLNGAATGYFINYSASYFYGLGTGTSIYALLSLARPLFVNNTDTGSRESVKMALMLTFGFLCIYFAALFHS
jgi:hypothetical protein